MLILYKYITEKLEEAEAAMKKEGARWHSFEDVAKEMREKLIAINPN